MTAAGAAYAAMGLVILACIAIGYAISGDGSERARYSFWVRAARYRLTRLRYARRMRGPLPARDQGIAYDRRKWLGILDAWDGPAAPAEDQDVSRFHGPSFKGAMRTVRALKRAEAEKRNAATPPERRRRWRLAAGKNPR